MLEFIRETDKRGKRGEKYGLFKCLECEEQTIKEIEIRSVKRGHTKSCGCLLKKHGLCYTVEYLAWKHMNSRCYNPNNKDYPDYGKRGIEVCPRWKNHPKVFIQDMGLKPSPELSVERRNVNGNYCPENCYWGTNEQQANNRTNNRIEKYKGREQTLSRWCKELNLNYGLVNARLNQCKWSVEKAFETPVMPSKCDDRCKKVTIRGETKLLRDWLKMYKVSRRTYCDRVRKGQSIEEAITTTPRPKRKNRATA